MFEKDFPRIIEKENDSQSKDDTSNRRAAEEKKNKCMTSLLLHNKKIQTGQNNLKKDIDLLHSS